MVTTVTGHNNFIKNWGQGKDFCFELFVWIYSRLYVVRSIKSMSWNMNGPGHS